ncbi:MAG: DUF1109 domain-containing protein [Hyphomicrobium sp.]|jgi:hypothetical protein
MKTDDLINAISADTQAARAPINWIVWGGVAVGVVLTALLFSMLLSVRPNFEAALGDWRFLMKWAFSLTLLTTAVALTMRLARPQWVSDTTLLVLLGAPLVLMAGIFAEMLTLPANYWLPTMVGDNALACVIYIPILSSLPLAAMIMALRQGAPSRPVVAGATAGLVAAGIAATFYATHCTNDSPMFLGAWYLLGTAIVTAAGALLGAKLLRW